MRQSDRDITRVWCTFEEMSSGKLNLNPRPLVRADSWPYNNAYNTFTRTLVDAFEGCLSRNRLLLVLEERHLSGMPSLLGSDLC